MDIKNPNLLVIVLDTVRARSTTVGGRHITPTLAAEMEHGTTFKNAIAPSTWSLSSHASLFTGTYPTEHGATLSTEYLQDDQTTLAERLSATGYRTGIFTANLYLSGAFNMSRGFNESSFAVRSKLFSDGISVDEFILRENWNGQLELGKTILQEAASGNAKNVANLVYGKLDSMLGERSGENDHDRRKQWDETIVDHAARFLKSGSDDQPFFCFVNLLAAHGPWGYNESLLRSIDVDPSEYGTDEEWEAVAAMSENQWPYAAGELSFDDCEQEMLELLYEAWVHRADEYAGDLLEALDEAGHRDDTLVVLTADHGEVIAEDRILGHTASLKDESLRVPLVVSGPGVGVDTIESVVSLKDLYGTLLDRTGIDTDAASWFDEVQRGEALAETHGVDPDDIRSHLDEIPDEMMRFFQHRRRVYTDEGMVERWYDSEKVIGDTSILPRLNKIVENLTVVNTDVEGTEITEEVSDRLEQLGYMQGGSSE